jgi:adenylate cyclase
MKQFKIQTLPRTWLAGAVIAALAAVFGVLSLLRLGGGIARLSYDVPFATRANIRANEVAIVYLDELSHAELNQPFTAPWDRALHARLINKLVAEGAKAIVFDILFTSASSNPQADQSMAEAIQRSHRVIMGGNLGQGETVPGAGAEWEEVPFEPFAAGAAGWGNVNFLPDPDYGIRCFFPNLTDTAGRKSIVWMPWAVAQFVGAPATRLHQPQDVVRYINYYGPPGTLPSASYSKVLQTNGVPPGFFKNKVVFIGAKLSADFSGKGKDEFATPYTRWGQGFAPGVEIHATAFVNLVRGDWLVRMPFWVEVVLVFLNALSTGLTLIRLRPLQATLATLGIASMIAIGAHVIVWYGHFWFAWMTLVMQLGLGLFCAVVYNSLRLYVEKRLVEQSLSSHLSPALVKRLVQDPSLRRPGGVKQEVSFLFTDIANFSRVSEDMHPDDLVNLLNRYFATALKCIHETDGTVVDLIGDAIFAIWNAPVEQPDHRERACRSAIKLHEQLVNFDATQRSLPLRTRVGLHTGTACVGNIGSEVRFDYTAIGENTNLASRLEGANKHLGTEVLATREIQRAVEETMTSRLVGHIRFKGFGRAVEIYELLGSRDIAEQSHTWRDKFAEALQYFRQRKFEIAERAFRETVELRKTAEKRRPDADGHPPDDGPSIFYLEQIVAFRTAPPPYEWVGEVTLKEK